MAFLQLSHHGAPIIQEWAKRQQRDGRAAQDLHWTERIMPMAFRGEPGVLVNPNSKREAAACREMFHYRGDDWRLLPEAHALGEIASIVRKRHRKAQEVEFGVGFGGRLVENPLLTIDLCFYGDPRFL